MQLFKRNKSFTFLEPFLVFYGLTIYKLMRSVEMLKQVSRLQIVVVLFLIAALFYPVDAFAWGHGDGRYYYHGGRWYRPSRFWFDVAVPAITLGTIVASLPPGYTTVVVKGVPYYYYDNAYFQVYPSGGYVVIPSPVAVSADVPKATESAVITASTITNVGSNLPATQQDIFTVNIPNSKGGYTPVALKRVKGGFTGPQGEFYQEFPSVEQLKVMYGNKKD